MAKAVAKKPKATAPDDLTMDLFAPGMTMMHRAGLGGLACSLKYIERAYRAGQLADDDVPGAPWPDNHPPWEITSRTITLKFGEAKQTGEYLKRLFAMAFALDQGLISLPGQYGDVRPPRHVLAQLQNALTLTFLQHGRVRKLDKKETTLTYDPDGSGTKVVSATFKACSQYKHQEMWKSFVGGTGALKGKEIEVIGPLSPGTIVRHVAFNSQSKIVDTPAGAMCLCFAIVGTLSLAANRGVGLLVVPDVEDLEAFIYDRPALTPKSARQCRVASASDAVLQAQLQLRARHAAQETGVPGCTGVMLAPTPWASQQKSRVHVVQVDAANQAALNLFEVALLELPPRIVQRKEGSDSFWADSGVRPFIADNLALGRPWYAGFRDLVASPDFDRRVRFEKKGLHAMMDKITWDNEGAETVVKAVHEAIRKRFGRIADENRSNPVARKKRWGREYERWRLAFAGAKTADQFRDALTDLWSRAGNNPVLKQSWPTVLPMLQDDQWKLTRDLALLGLASYTGREAEEMELAQPEEEGEPQ